jgi:phospholipid/cholesterol/gamma-HCH transport system substrate-binding protein
LVAIPPSGLPVITSKPSVVQELTDAAPDLLNEAIALIQDVRTFTTPENRKALTAILQNVESATTRIDAIATRAETLVAGAEATLARADAALTAAEAAFANADAVITDDLPGLLDGLKTTVADIGAAAAEVKDFARTDLQEYGALATRAQGVLGTIGTVVDRIGRDPGRFLLGTQTPEYRN